MRRIKILFLYTHTHAHQFALIIVFFLICKLVFDSLTTQNQPKNKLLAEHQIKYIKKNKIKKSAF